MAIESLKALTDIPNIGEAMERDFRLLNIKQPADLIGRDPYQLYEELCSVTQKKHDPCVLDVSAVRYMEGGPPKKWWGFTEGRKRGLGRDRMIVDVRTKVLRGGWNVPAAVLQPNHRQRQLTTEVVRKRCGRRAVGAKGISCRVSE